MLKYSKRRVHPLLIKILDLPLIRILAENSNFHDYLRKDQQFISHEVLFSISPLPTPIKMAGNQHPSSLQEDPRFSFQSCHLSNGLRLR